MRVDDLAAFAERGLLDVPDPVEAAAYLGVLVTAQAHSRTLYGTLPIADDELTAARALVAKKASATRGLDPMVRDRRLAGVLGRRGFGSGIIATVLAELRDGAVLDPAEGAP